MPLKDKKQSPREVWEALQAGNERFRDNSPLHPHSDEERRAGLRGGQDPRVVVLSCSDSRAPVEILFDLGLGDAFVIRTAGHILDTAVKGSLEYALENLNCNLVVILGHQSCGAVSATAAVVDQHAELPAGFQRAIIEKVTLSTLKSKRAGNSSTDDYERQHVRETVDQLVASLSVLQHKVEEGTVGVIGARYLLEDSTVETLVTHGLD